MRIGFHEAISVIVAESQTLGRGWSLDVGFRWLILDKTGTILSVLIGHNDHASCLQDAGGEVQICGAVDPDTARFCDRLFQASAEAVVAQ